MTTLTRGSLAAGVITELHHQRPDSGQDAFDLRRMPLFPFLLLRGTLDNAGRPYVERFATVPDGFVEGQLQTVEHLAEHLHRALENVLVAQPNPLLCRDLPQSVEREAIRHHPLVGAHVLEWGSVVVAPARRKKKRPFLERTAIDVDRTRQRPEQLAQCEMPVVKPAVHQRADVVAPVAVDVDEPRLWEQAVEIRHAHGVDARLVQDLSQTQPLEEIALRRIAMLRPGILRPRRLGLPAV